MAQVNHAIGAKGVLSTECKMLVSQYGDMIWDLLVNGVHISFPFPADVYILFHIGIKNNWKKFLVLSAG